MGATLTYATASLISMQQVKHLKKGKLASSGNVAALNLGIYSDSDCSQVIESIEWGDIIPGESVNKAINIKNTGSTQIILSMATRDWKPKKADQKITITWDKEGAKLDPNEVAKATLKLTVAENITNIDNFKVTIIISGYA